MKDEIIEEIHKLREAHAARFNNDLLAICKDAQQRQGKDGRKVVQAAPKPADESALNGNAA